jgi:hypothetical protein
MQRRLFFITSLLFGMKFADGEELRRGVHILSLFPCLQRLDIRVFNCFVSPAFRYLFMMVLLLLLHSHYDEIEEI